MTMRKSTAIVLVLIAVLLTVAAARGGGSWLIRKIRVMHGAH